MFTKDSFLVEYSQRSNADRKRLIVAFPAFRSVAEQYDAQEKLAKVAEIKAIAKSFRSGVVEYTVGTRTLHLVEIIELALSKASLTGNNAFNNTETFPLLAERKQAIWTVLKDLKAAHTAMGLQWSNSVVFLRPLAEALLQSKSPVEAHAYAVSVLESAKAERVTSSDLVIELDDEE